MITETKEVYKCEYCRKLYQIKRFCIYHEIACSKNPTNERICFGCVHMEVVEEELYFDTYHGESSRMVTVFNCKNFDQFLIPPKAEHKGNAFEFGDKLNEPMRTKCAGFEQAPHTLDDSVKLPF